MPAPQSTLTIIPVRCFLRDVNIGYSLRFQQRNTIECRIGWVHPNKFLHTYYDRWLNSSEMRFNGASVYLQLNHWRFNKKGQSTFVGIIAGYRYLWFCDKQLTVYDPDGRSYDEDLTLSQWRNDFFLLATIGKKTSDWSTFEFSIGLRCMWTHSNVSKTKFYYSNWTQEQYDEYIQSTLSRVAHAEGFAVIPVIRVTSRLGLFKW